ncbi:MAG: type II secretion system protein [Candidatus Portnoybacteria bacterium]|nr:type II secretion system protein [Candidatus Portnoybacteria bacterium]
MKKAFTLIELLIVIAIIGILAGVLFVSIGQKPLVQARDSKRTADLQNVRTALTLYYTDNASYPLALADLTPTYIPAVPIDPKNATAGCNQTYGADANYKYRYSATTGANGVCTTLAKDCTNYVVQACLEDGSNSSLATDCDNASAVPPCIVDRVYDIHS